MTRFEYFKYYGTDGEQLGIISPSMYARYIRYSVYLDLSNGGLKKSEAILEAAERCSCDTTMIHKAIYFFTRPGYR